MTPAESELRRDTRASSAAPCAHYTAATSWSATLADTHTPNTKTPFAQASVTGVPTWLDSSEARLAQHGSSTPVGGPCDCAGKRSRHRATLCRRSTCLTGEGEALSLAGCAAWAVSGAIATPWPTPCLPPPQLSAAISTDLTVVDSTGSRVVSVVWEAGSGESSFPKLCFWSVGAGVAAEGHAGLVKADSHAGSDVEWSWEGGEAADDGALLGPAFAPGDALGSYEAAAALRPDTGPFPAAAGAGGAETTASPAHSQPGAQQKVGGALLETADEAVLDGAGRAFGASVEAHPVHGRACMQLHGCDANRRLQAVLGGHQTGANPLASDPPADEDWEAKWRRLVAWLALHGPVVGLRISSDCFRALIDAGHRG